jgi:hypothetical protein
MELFTVRKNLVGFGWVVSSPLGSTLAITFTRRGAERVKARAIAAARYNDEQDRLEQGRIICQTQQDVKE